MDGHSPERGAGPVPTLRQSVHGGTYFRDFGSEAGDPVVLIHGVGLDHAMWAAQVAALSARFRVVTYDLLGHGSSAQPPDERRLSDFVNQLDQLMMNLNLEKAAVVGFSMGARVARAFAARFPDRVSKLVLMNSVYQRSPEEQAGVEARLAATETGDTETLADAALARWFSDAYRDSHPDTCDAIRARLLGNDAEDYLKAYRVFAQPESDTETLDAVTCPALVMTGELDTGSTPAMTDRLAAALPNARAMVLDGLRHMAPVEGATAVNAALLDFLSDREDA